MDFKDANQDVNTSGGTPVREEGDEDREQRTNTTLKKDMVQTTSTNNLTPIAPFYMHLRYSISPVTHVPTGSMKPRSFHGALNQTKVFQLQSDTHPYLALAINDRSRSKKALSSTSFSP